MDPDLIERFNGLSKALNGALKDLEAAGAAVAEKEREYREYRSQAWLQAKANHPDMLAKEKEDWVNALCADLRYLRDVEEGKRVSALESVRSKRTQVSALQTIANVSREEAAFARTEPS